MIRLTCESVSKSQRSSATKAEHLHVGLRRAMQDSRLGNVHISAIAELESPHGRVDRYVYDRATTGAGDTVAAVE